MRRLLPALRPRLLPRAIVAAACAWALLVAAVLGAGSSSAIPDPSFGNSNKGLYPSLRLDGSGNPVVAYFNATNGDLKLLHCAVASCEGAGASISSPDTADTTGLYPSLRLDAAGNPAASYYEQSNGNLRLMRCNDPNCAGGDESLVTVDAPGDVGQFTSLALDAAGRPVAAYYDATGGNLKVAHCNDANCAGDNESITAPATAGDVGRYASLALDSNGWPVVSYYNATSKTVTVTHCNDANCAGNNESIATPDSSPIDAG